MLIGAGDGTPVRYTQSGAPGNPSRGNEPTRPCQPSRHRWVCQIWQHLPNPASLARLVGVHGLADLPDLADPADLPDCVRHSGCLMWIPVSRIRDSACLGPVASPKFSGRGDPPTPVDLIDLADPSFPGASRHKMTCIFLSTRTNHCPFSLNSLIPAYFWMCACILLIPVHFARTFPALRAGNFASGIVPPENTRGSKRKIGQAMCQPRTARYETETDSISGGTSSAHTRASTLSACRSSVRVAPVGRACRTCRTCTLCRSHRKAVHVTGHMHAMTPTHAPTRHTTGAQKGVSDPTKARKVRHLAHVVY